MQVEHLRQWLQEAMQEKDPGDTHWMKVVAIAQAAFRNGTLADDIIWQVMVLILKGDGRDLRGIGLVEVHWKTMIVILNRRFASVIHLHEVLHGFWAGRRTGTAALEYKLLQQITAMRKVVLYDIFLDL